MSDPMTTVEIEDVLFSIRRLVSEDLRPTHKLVSAALQKTAAKLILTPALRIVAEVRSALPERATGSDEPSNLQSVLYDIEAGNQAGSADGMPVFGSVRQSDPTLPAEDRVTVGQEGLVSDANFLTTAMSRINGLTGGTGAIANPSDTIEAVVAAVGAAVGPDEWELDGGDPVPQATAWADANWSSDVASGRSDSGAKITGVLHLATNADMAGSGDASGGSGPELEANPEPGQTESGEGALVGADSIVFHERISAEDETSQQASTTDELDETAGFVSEDLLREIVRDMIRDELQGTLGERITRNVRKLVRAEINRAMASRDFDDIANRG